MYRPASPVFYQVEKSPEKKGEFEAGLVAWSLEHGGYFSSRCAPHRVAQSTASPGVVVRVRTKAADREMRDAVQVG